MGISIHFSRADGSHHEEAFNNNVETIDLSSRNISQIDLSSLRSNSSLRALHLNENQLSVLDLEPLRGCTNLRSLHLQENQITRLDVTPLIRCSKLNSIWLDDDVENETLLSNSNMENRASDYVIDQIGTFDSLSNLLSLSAVFHVYQLVKKHEPDWKIVHLFHNALALSGLGGAGMLDVKVSLQRKLLEQIESKTFKDELQEFALSALCAQIDRGGPTVNLDIDFMNLHGDLAIRIDDVLELRQCEMQNVQVPILKWAIDNESVELMELAGERVHTTYAELSYLLLTAYGYEILESLNIGTIIDLDSFCKVEDALESMGFNIVTNIDPTPYDQMSRSSRKVLKSSGIQVKEPDISSPKDISLPLVEYIWALADFRSRLEG